MGLLELGGITDPQIQRNFQTIDRLLIDTGDLGLRLRAGTVSAAGAVTQGSGFTVTKGAAGVFTINVGFSTTPVVLATVGSTAGVSAVKITSASTTAIGVLTFDAATGASTDGEFHWVAIG